MLDFHDLYEAYATDVYRFGYWLSGESAEAEDITSETFIRAWVRLDTIRTETLRAYLFTIARNVYLEGRRKQARLTRLDQAHPDPNPGPEQLAAERAELERVRRILQTLPEADRAAFIMRVEYEMPYAEIARVLQLSEGAIKVKVHRARTKMLAARTEKEVL